MVLYGEIQASNALIDDETAPRISVFVGGTSGIGKLTIRALVATNASMRIYLVGRKTVKEPMSAFIGECNAVNSKAEIIWIEGEVSLLKETKRICDLIRSKESRINLIFLTTGYAPFGPRTETAEGLEIAQSLEYYTRMLFVLHLLPLLEAAEAPRVISVLAGALVKTSINLDDMDLKRPENFGGVSAQMQYGAMNTMFLEKLADENPNITFIHSWPGIVNTGNVRRSADPNSFMGWVFWLIFEPIIYLIALSDEESGQRHLFQCTSALFGGRGISWTGKTGVNSMNEPANGLFLVNNKCDCTPNVKVMPILREKAREKVWHHTQKTLQPFLHNEPGA